MGLSGDYPVQGFDGGDDREPRRSGLQEELWPKQATFAKEEQRRFEILLAHWALSGDGHYSGKLASPSGHLERWHSYQPLLQPIRLASNGLPR